MKETKEKKPYGYWSEERCFNAAKSCETIKEFSTKYNTAYIKSITHGWRKKYLWLKPTEKYDLNEPIYCIYIYEDKENEQCYIGLTKNLAKRKSSHKKREFYKRKDGTIYRHYDSVRQYFFDIHKEIPEPSVLEEHLTAKEAQEREDFWCQYYKSNGWKLINKAKTGNGSSSIGGYPEKWTDEALIKLASDFTTPEQLKKKHSWAYKCIRTRNLLGVCFPQKVDDLPNEVWKDIAGYENHYQISNLKRIKRLTQGVYRGEKIVSIFLKHNTPHVSLWLNNKPRVIQVKKLYQEAFTNLSENSCQ